MKKYKVNQIKYILQIYADKKVLIFIRNSEVSCSVTFDIKVNHFATFKH